MSPEDENKTLVYSSDNYDDSMEIMCFKRGPNCFQTSIIDIFSGDKKVSNSLHQEDAFSEKCISMQFTCGVNYIS